MFNYFKKHSFIVLLAAILVLVVAVITGRSISKKPVSANDTAIKKVTLVNAATFREGNLSVSADGIVESHSQADLKSQTSAPVALINVGIGDNVYQGQVLLELQNNDIRAQLAEGQAALAVAKGQQYTGGVSLTSAKQAAIDKIRDAYLKSYDAVVSEADPILYNNDGSGGHLQSFSTDTKTNSEISEIDLDLKSIFPDWNNTANSLDASVSSMATLSSAIQSSQTNLNSTLTLLGDISKILNSLTGNATPTFAASLGGWKATISGARASVSAAAQALTGAETGLNAASASQGSTVPAGVDAAEAGVGNLQAQLAKTIVRSPITGKVSALPLYVGELATPGTLLATVVGNESGIRVKAYASGEDLYRIKIGAPVKIEGNIDGVVSSLSPSIDTVTKKAEIDIDITNSDQSDLVIGQNVSVSISASNTAQQVSNGTDLAGQNNQLSYLLPIQDVKIIPGGGSVVFTIDGNSKIKSNNVTVGKVQGDFIEITGGISDSMNIVAPVYELDPGETVTAN